MRRKNLIVVRKVEKKKSSIKDLKIKKIYTKFKSVILKKGYYKNFLNEKNFNHIIYNTKHS